MIGGYALLFGVAGQSNDLVMPCAFRVLLRRRRAADVRRLFQHDATEPNGTWVSIMETDCGLPVGGRLDPRVERGCKLNGLFESGGLDGVSIGFKTRTAMRDRVSGVRKLLQLDLWEILSIGIGGRSLEKIAAQWLARK